MIVMMSNFFYLCINDYYIDFLSYFSFPNYSFYIPNFGNDGMLR